MNRKEKRRQEIEMEKIREEARKANRDILLYQQKLKEKEEV